MHFDRARGWSKKPFRLQSGSGLSFHKLDIWYSKQLLAAAVWLKNSTLCVTKILYERFVLFCLGWTPRNNKKKLIYSVSSECILFTHARRWCFFQPRDNIIFYRKRCALSLQCQARAQSWSGLGSSSDLSVWNEPWMFAEILRSNIGSQGSGRRVKVAFTLSWRGVGWGWSKILKHKYWKK